MLNQETFKRYNIRQQQLHDVNYRFGSDFTKNYLHDIASPKFSENYILRDILTSLDVTFIDTRSMGLGTLNQIATGIGNLLLQRFDYVKGVPTPNGFPKIVISTTYIGDHPDTTDVFKKINLMIHKEYPEETLEKQIEITELFTEYLKTQIPKAVITDIRKITNNTKVYFMPRANAIFMNIGVYYEKAILGNLAIPFFLFLNSISEGKAHDLLKLSKDTLSPEEITQHLTQIYDLQINSKMEEAIPLLIAIETALEKEVMLESPIDVIKKNVKGTLDTMVKVQNDKIKNVEADIVALLQKKETYIIALKNVIKTYGDEDNFFVTLAKTISRLPQILDLKVSKASDHVRLDFYINAPLSVDPDFVHKNMISSETARDFFQFIVNREMELNIFGIMSLKVYSNGLKEVFAPAISNLEDYLPRETIHENALKPNYHHAFYNCLGNFQSAMMSALNEENAFGFLLNAVMSVATLNLSDTTVTNRFIGNVIGNTCNIIDKENDTLTTYGNFLVKKGKKRL